MLLDYLEELHSLDTIESVWNLHLGAMAEFGFDRLLYASTRNRTENSYGSHRDGMILTNHDPDYMVHFVEGGLYSESPMFKWAADNTGAGSWANAARYFDPTNQRQLELVSLNAKFGLSAGYTISFRESSSRNKSAIALVAPGDVSQQDVDERWQTHGRVLTQMNYCLHHKLITLPYDPPDRRLTRRQREVLEWVGNGKTTQDIATIMGLTSATIEKHLRLARETLDVDTTAQAVLKASFNNQIFVMRQ